MKVATQDSKTVLVFDSGVGGISVYQELSQLLPQLNYVYLFDNAAYPYGELDQSILIERVLKLVCEFVREHKVDIVVIACNTASTIVLPHLRRELSIPVVGVVPAIKPASLLSSKCIGVIATPATVTRQYTHDLIKNFSANKPVKLVGSTRLVDLAEEKLRGKAVSLDELRDILSELQGTIDVAVLGCTHFPLLKEEIGLVLGPDVALIDSGAAIARRVAELLDIKSGGKQELEHLIFSSAPPWESDALNHALKQRGFSKIQILPTLDV
nr:glutamate racemase [Vibrio tapetis]